MIGSTADMKPTAPRGNSRNQRSRRKQAEHRVTIGFILGAITALAVLRVVLPASEAVLRTHSSQRVEMVASTTTSAPPRAEWSGPVEHIFFHPLVRRPDLAFAQTTLGKGYRDFFVTVEEFGRILEQLYQNNWVLTDMHAAVNGPLMVPIGKQPLVISIDDLNFYQYMRDNGGSWRLALDGGRVRLEVHDPATGLISFTDEEIVPMLDEFVVQHPDFSLDNAKAVIGLTGYQGVLGERVVDDPAAQSRAIALAKQLKATGWLFASHSYGHIPINRRTESQIRTDATKWRNQVESIVGPTDIFIYPYGAAPAGSSGKIKLLREEFGFSIFCEIDSTILIDHRDGWTRFPRRHVDGLAFRDQADNLAPLFDVSAVIDDEARS